MEWRRVNEQIELETEGVEPLLRSYAGYTSEVRMTVYTTYNKYIAIQQTAILRCSSYSRCPCCTCCTVHVLTYLEQTCIYITDHVITTATAIVVAITSTAVLYCR
jgi:hypothetical protein